MTRCEVCDCLLRDPTLSFCDPCWRAYEKLNCEMFATTATIEQVRQHLGLACETTEPKNIKAHIADEAKRIVDGARRGVYGQPEDNFLRIARYWTVHLQNTGRDVTITAQDVSPMMVLLKMARLDASPEHYDSHVDLVGYALTGAEVNGVKPPD